MLPYIEKINYENAPEGVAIYLVDGQYVRDNISADFTMGGHDKVYPFIPPGEVWVEKSIAPEEIEYIILHELDERDSMGEGLSYEDAHEKATQYESLVRSSRWQKFAQLIEITDRYDALGIPHPDPETICHGQCEGIGLVPIYLEEFDPNPICTPIEKEADPVFIALFMEEEDKNPTDDGWHFVKCPECGGTGKRSKKAYNINKEDLKTLWYEDAEGNYLDVAMYDEKGTPNPHPPEAKYMVSRFPNVLRTTYLELTDAGSKEVFSGESSFSDDLVLALVESGNFTLDEAIIFAAEACERCTNSAANDYGLDWGYPEGSEDWEASKTSCDFCRHLDKHAWFDEPIREIDKYDEPLSFAQAKEEDEIENPPKKTKIRKRLLPRKH